MDFVDFGKEFRADTNIIDRCRTSSFNLLRENFLMFYDFKPVNYLFDIILIKSPILIKLHIF